MPRARRNELDDEIEEHIAETRASGVAEEDGTEIRNVLDRLGRAGRDRGRGTGAFTGVGLQRRGPAPVEIFALIGLLVGGFVFVIGWFVGLVLLWVSNAWSDAREARRHSCRAGWSSARGPSFSLGAFGVYSRCGGGYEVDLGHGSRVKSSAPVVPSRSPRAVLWITLLAVCLVGPIFTTALPRAPDARPAAAATSRAPGSA